MTAIRPRLRVNFTTQTNLSPTAIESTLQSLGIQATVSTQFSNGDPAFMAAISGEDNISALEQKCIDLGLEAKDYTNAVSKMAASNN
jgi:hypothetical protein